MKNSYVIFNFLLLAQVIIAGIYSTDLMISYETLSDSYTTFKTVDGKS
jgi:hypothetical protein